MVCSGLRHPFNVDTMHPLLIVLSSFVLCFYLQLFDCKFTGAIVCTQCEGRGVNSVDHFNGRFKAGALCWLCRGKREILCGSCNGAGFLGGFLSTFDETSD